jgi:hypothetical protein
MDLNKMREIIRHNNDIIDDNIVFGYKSRTPESEIKKYSREAKREQLLLKKHIKNGGDVEWDKTTHMWVIKP